MVFHITLSVMHIANYKLGLSYSSSAYPWSIFSTWYSSSGSKWLKMHFLFFFGTFSFSGNIPSICRLGKNVWNNVQTFWKYCWLCTTRLRIFYRIRILKYKPGVTKTEEMLVKFLCYETWVKCLDGEFPNLIHYWNTSFIKCKI